MDDDTAAVIVGDSEARLLALVRRRLSPRIARRVDADDIVQSTYRSFFRRAASGELTVEEDAWPLLASMARHKLLRQIERHQAGRRSVAREVGSADAHAMTHDDPATIAELTDEVAALGIDDEERRVLGMRLAEATVDEIAADLGRSDRTVRRILRRLERRLEHRWGLRSRTPGLESTRGAAIAPEDLLLQRLVGQGGGGKVYRAVDRRSGETVAVKFLAKALLERSDLVERFRIEVRVLERLLHPNIVQLRGVGRLASGLPFLVTDWHPAGNLKSHLGRCSVDAAVTWTHDVAQAVAHAHAAGIVHCDLNPANVLLDAQRRAVVADFGHAVLDDGIVPGGTHGYTAPELTATDEASPSIDVYGLGAILFALIEGQPPPVPCVFAASAWSRELREACAGWLSVDPALRPTAAEVVEALNGRVEG